MSHPVRFQIRVRVQGELAPTWSTVLADLAVAAEPDGTTLVTGELADQAALHGFLAAVRDGLTLISVETVAIPRTERRRSDGPRPADRPRDGGAHSVS
jgi:hypothetical protein